MGQTKSKIKNIGDVKTKREAKQEVRAAKQVLVRAEKQAGKIQIQEEKSQEKAARVLKAEEKAAGRKQQLQVKAKAKKAAVKAKEDQESSAIAKKQAAVAQDTE